MGTTKQKVSSPRLLKRPRSKKRSTAGIRLAEQTLVESEGEGERTQGGSGELVYFVSLQVSRSCGWALTAIVVQTRISYIMPLLIPRVIRRRTPNRNRLLPPAAFRVRNMSVSRGVGVSAFAA